MDGRDAGRDAEQGADGIDDGHGDDPERDLVFRALADSSRRALLDALRDRDGRTLGELCDVLPTMTRFGVMKHLAVLEAARLVTSERVGRTKLHHLNPVPIREIHDRWISRYTEPLVAGLLTLRDHAEGA